MSNRREFLRACAGVSATAMAASMSRLGIIDAFAQDHADPAPRRVRRRDRLPGARVHLPGGRQRLLEHDRQPHGLRTPTRRSGRAWRSRRPSCSGEHGAALRRAHLRPAPRPGRDPPVLGHRAGWRSSPTWARSWSRSTAPTYLARPDLRPPPSSRTPTRSRSGTRPAPRPALLTGWGGRVGDRTLHMNGDIPFPMMVSLAGATLFGTGAVVRPLEVTSGGSGRPGGLQHLVASTQRYNAMKALLSERDRRHLRAIRRAATGRAIETNELLTHALATQTAARPPCSPTPGWATSCGWWRASSTAARSLNIHREIFFVQIGGFDTHAGQLTSQANLLTAARAGDGGLLQRDRRDGRRRLGHAVHRLGLLAHVQVQRQRDRPRLGRLPVRAGRRGARRANCTATGPCCVVGPERLGQPGPLHPDDRGRPVLGDARHVVRAGARRRERGVPQHPNFNPTTWAS